MVTLHSFIIYREDENLSILSILHISNTFFAHQDPLVLRPLPYLSSGFHGVFLRLF